MQWLRLKGFESRLGRVFQTCVSISYHDKVTERILNQYSKLGCTSIENGYSVATVDYLAIVDNYPVIFTADMKGNMQQCGLGWYSRYGLKPSMSVQRRSEPILIRLRHEQRWLRTILYHLNPSLCCVRSLDEELTVGNPDYYVVFCLAVNGY